MKGLFKVNEKNNLGVLVINQLMSKLLTLSNRFQLHCLQITAIVCTVTLNFEHAYDSRISHFTYRLRHYIITDHVLTSYVRGHPFTTYAQTGEQNKK